jgi:hypothetical protein
MEPEQKITSVVQRIGEPVTIKLKRGAKGVYQWEIQVSGETADWTLYTVSYLDGELRKLYVEQEVKT